MGLLDHGLGLFHGRDKDSQIGKHGLFYELILEGGCKVDAKWLTIMHTRWLSVRERSLN